MFFQMNIIAYWKDTVCWECQIKGVEIDAGSWALVAHICNPSYSGGRDQEDHGSKPAWAHSPQDPILKEPITKKGWWSGSRCRPWVQTPVPPTHTHRHTHTHKEIDAGRKRTLVKLFSVTMWGLISRGYMVTLVLGSSRDRQKGKAFRYRCKQKSWCKVGTGGSSLLVAFIPHWNREQSLLRVRMEKKAAGEVIIVQERG
jgi:hypothetical protein